MVSVSIILPTFNRGRSLKNCLESVLSQSFDDWELIIIDDHSKDPVANVVNKFADDRIHYYRNQANFGLPFSRNLGVTKAKGKFVFFIEDDMILHKDCLKILVETFYTLEANHKVGAVGPRIRNFRRNFHRRKTQYIVGIGKLTGIIYQNFDQDTSRVVEVPTLHSCSLINREIFREIGGFEYKLYKGTYFREETDFYYRVRAKKYKLFFQPKAILYHKRASTGGCRVNKIKANYYYVRNHALFLLRFYKLKSFSMIPAFLIRCIFRISKVLDLNEEILTAKP